jgi:molecular chaperone GrpE
MAEEQQPETIDTQPASPAGTGGVHTDPVVEPDPVAEAEAEGAEAPPTEAAEAEADAKDEAEPDYRDLYLRAVADADNVRKRARRDVGVAEARGMARVVRELLPALDNLERAIAAAEAQELDEEHHMTKGIRLVQQELASALQRVGIEAFSPKGETFDPHQHEAVAQQPVEGAEAGTVVEVYQAGYRYKDEILRAAKVVVAA